MTVDILGSNRKSLGPHCGVAADFPSEPAVPSEVVLIVFPFADQIVFPSADPTLGRLRQPAILRGLGLDSTPALQIQHRRFQSARQIPKHESLLAGIVLALDRQKAHARSQFLVIPILVDSRHH